MLCCFQTSPLGERMWHSTEPAEHKNGEYELIRDAEDPHQGMYDKPLPCFGCGIGWFSCLLGFVFPLMWYFASILYFKNYYRRDPRERAGLAASAIAQFLSSSSRRRSTKPVMEAQKRTGKKQKQIRKLMNHWKFSSVQL
ncbi:hypothetical protein V6N11_048733 [Hibiscus sabdariffa]|uniref:Uncharacterized protein n=1 Tax=Hibiscus sabdariffa TaxID=183260 RepID=A0ABR2PW28_9ROSI